MWPQSPNISRRRFFELGVAASALALGAKPSSSQTIPGRDSIVVATNGSPTQLVSGALHGLGGIDSFVGPGDFVLIKPNASFSVTPGSGANTDPEVAATVASLCIQAGADTVVLADHTINKPGKLTVQINGLKGAAEGCGADFAILEKASEFESINIEEGRVLRKVDVAKLYGESDVLINLPVLKHHDATGSSVGLKNLMGLVFDRTVFHREGLESCIADLSLTIQPDLTIVDATRVLTSNGPRGPGEVIDVGKVVAGVDPVAVDTASLGLISSLGYPDFAADDRWNRYIGIASELGIGDGDPESVGAKTVEWDVMGGGGQCVIDGRGAGLPDWWPYASLSAASLAIGLFATIYDRRKVRDVRRNEG